MQVCSDGSYLILLKKTVKKTPDIYLLPLESRLRSLYSLCKCVTNKSSALHVLSLRATGNQQSQNHASHHFTHLFSRLLQGEDIQVFQTIETKTHEGADLVDLKQKICKLNIELDTDVHSLKSIQCKSRDYFATNADNLKKQAHATKKGLKLH